MLIVHGGNAVHQANEDETNDMLVKFGAQALNNVPGQPKVTYFSSKFKETRQRRQEQGHGKLEGGG